MFSENFYTLRKAKGYSQEELAIRLNVVRQTISRWEKGLSVPGADTLIRIADIFEVSVSDLLNEKIETEVVNNAVAEQLSRINEQLIVANYRALRRWRAVAIVLVIFVIAGTLGVFANVFAHKGGEYLVIGSCDRLTDDGNYDIKRMIAAALGISEESVTITVAGSS